MLIKKVSKHAIHMLLDADDFDHLHLEFNREYDFDYNALVELSRKKSLRKLVEFRFVEEANYILIENSDVLRFTLDDDHRVQFLDLISASKKSGYLSNIEFGECELNNKIFSVYLGPYLSVG